MASSAAMPEPDPDFDDPGIPEAGSGKSKGNDAIAGLVLLVFLVEFVQLAVLVGILTAVLP